MPMPPKWALGHQQSRYSYYPESEVMQVAETYRKHDLPLDAIHLDINYINGYRDSLGIHASFQIHAEPAHVRIAWSRRSCMPTRKDSRVGRFTRTMESVLRISATSFDAPK